MKGNSKTNNKKQQLKGKRAPYKKYSGSKQDRRAEEIGDSAAAMSRSNPISTYNKYKQFSSDASKLPFSYPLGYKFDNLFKGPNTNLMDDENDFVVSGVMSLRFTPMIGVSSDFTSPINRSSIQAWTYIRSIMKAAGSYDHQDITMMIITLDSAMMFHAMLRRIYGLLPNVTPLNRYYCKAVINAAGVDYDDLIQNIQDFRAYINEFAYRLQAYAIPSGIELFNRHQWMCEGIYTDSESTRAQTYIFVPTGFWQYDNTVATGSQLNFKPWAIGVDSTGQPKTRMTYAEIMTFGNQLINAFAGDEDFAMISGDLYNLYKGRVTALPYIDENYRILPAYDKIVLSQIENATIVGPWRASDMPKISQNPEVNAGAIVFTGTTWGEATTANWYGDVAMNLHNDNPSPDEILEASRLTVLQEGTGELNQAKTQQALKIVACGTEVINQCNVYKLVPSQNDAVTALQLFYRKLLFSATDEDLDTVIGINSSMLQLCQFDWAPRIEVFENYASATDGNGPYHIIGVTWDVDNVADVDPSQLTIMHDACLWSEFDVPRMSAGS